MTGSPPTTRQMELAQASYARCQQSAGFIHAFYDRFLVSDPAIAPQFADTKFERQHRLLQHALGLLLSFGRRPNPNLLERLAVRHGPADLDVPPEQYPHFVDSLLGAVREKDPECTAEIEAAWRAVVAPGIDFMARFGR